MQLFLLQLSRKHPLFLFHVMMCGFGSFQFKAESSLLLVITFNVSLPFKHHLICVLQLIGLIFGFAFVSEETCLAHLKNWM